MEGGVEYVLAVREAMNLQKRIVNTMSFNVWRAKSFFHTYRSVRLISSMGSSLNRSGRSFASNSDVSLLISSAAVDSPFSKTSVPRSISSVVSLTRGIGTGSCSSIVTVPVV